MAQKDLKALTTAVAKVLWTLALIALSGSLISAAGTPPPASVTFAAAQLPNGITLHYAAEGHGEPVIFIPGSLADYSYWKDQVQAFSAHYRAIAYSRRYDYPNQNPPRAGYSAIADATDLALFIKKLRLGRVNVIGHSYGAYTALFLALRHPELVKSAILAEPPAVTLLKNAPGPLHALAAAQYGDIQRRLVAPVRSAFRAGDADRGVGVFMNYVFNNPSAWRTTSAANRSAEMRNAQEWRVMMTTGTLFPAVDPHAIQKIRTPILLMSGTASYPFLITITEILSSLLPRSTVLWVPGAGHQMWYQYPSLCRDAAQQFIRAQK
jgi:pimeloyl-ACP methyl ester carboxylesterase